MTSKAVRALLAADDAERAQERREARQRERRAALARYGVQARIDSMYFDAALGRPL